MGQNPSSSRLAIASCTVAVLMWLAPPALACTSVCLLDEGGAPVVAYNYDFHSPAGFALVNKRGAAKKSFLKRGGASWTVRYGSVTFTQYGRDSPMTGMNERGLMVSQMWLNETVLPPADERPVVGVLEFMQYNLDNYESVAEVLRNLESVRPMSPDPSVLHYFFADAKGDVATIEFLEGKPVVHRGTTLPVRALTNSTYADSLKAFRAARKAGEVPAQRDSLSRFTRAALLLDGKKGAPVDRAFAILQAVQQPNTRWSIVYELGAGRVHFKTDTNPAIRRFSLKDFDFACQTPVRMLDLTAAGSGDVGASFVVYTRSANRALIEDAFTKTPHIPKVSAAFKDEYAAHPDATSSCAMETRLVAHPDAARVGKGR